MRIAIGQINPTIGDFDSNEEKILAFSRRAHAEGCTLAVFPELSLCGYPPMDLLDHRTFLDENIKALRRLQRSVPSGISVVVGHVDSNRQMAGRPVQNVVSILRDGERVFAQAKTLLPTYDVFDEARYFEPAGHRRVFEMDGIRIGFAICEDLWWETEPIPGARYPVDPVQDLLDRGAQIIVAPSASPFYSDKPALRYRLASRVGTSAGVPVVYANLIGGNDNLIFDGYSMVTDSQGRLAHLCAGFEEELAVVEVAPAPEESTPPAGAITLPTDRYRDLEAALILGIRDYLRKTGFGRVHLGLSGGIDSAVVAVLAATAVGAENTKAFLLPSQYSSGGSVTDAAELAANLGIEALTVPIKEIFLDFERELEPHMEGRAPDVTEENVQARIRGTLLMAYSNKFSSLVLTTGNKSELATGYCTLYGDMSGSLAVIGDLFKTEVYELARYFNRETEVIPKAIMEKAPSAELRPDQKDEDSLPPYDLLDEILSLYVLESMTKDQITAKGYDADLVTTILSLVARSEYKRRQAPPVLKVSRKAFGTGRRMPIARALHEIRGTP